MHLSKTIFLLTLLILLPGGLHSQDTLKVALFESPPFVIQGAEGYSGLSLSLWEQIASQIGKPYQLVGYSDEVAVMRALTYGEADICINPMSSTPYRLEHFEMTQPFFHSGIGVASTLESQSKFRIFFRNFFSLAFVEIVLLLFGILLIFGTLLWFVERRHNKYQFRPGLLGLFDGLWWAAVTMTTVGYGDKAPKTHAGKTIGIIWMFTAVIIISSFTATIASTLTVNTLEADITGLKDLIAMERVGVVGSAQAASFAREKRIPVSNVYESAQQGLRALVRKDIEVLMHDRTATAYLIDEMELSGSVKLLNLNFKRQYKGFMLPKTHPLTRTIDIQLSTILSAESWRNTRLAYGLEP